MPTADRNGVTIGDQTPAAASGILKTGVSGPATVESVSWRIYPGAETTLQLRPVLIENGDEIDLLEYAADGKSYIDGDDDDRELRVSKPISSGNAEIGVRYHNTDGSNAHNWRVNFEVDRLGGAERVVSKVQSALGRLSGGVF